MSNIINNDMENKKYCAAAFLEVSQVFKDVWHSGSLNNSKTIRI